MVGRTLSASATTGGVVFTLLAMGWDGVALVAGVVLLLTATLCWIVNDPHRPVRLALLLSAWRGTPSPDRNSK